MDGQLQSSEQGQSRIVGSLHSPAQNVWNEFVIADPTLLLGNDSNVVVQKCSNGVDDVNQEQTSAQNLCNSENSSSEEEAGSPKTRVVAGSMTPLSN